LKFEVVFISYREENKEENFQKAMEFYPSILRVDNFKGIKSAFIEALRITKEEFVVMIDGDNEVWERIDFSPYLNSENIEKVQVFRSINAVNELVYGYGGVKIWSRKVLERVRDISNYVDLTTTIGASSYKVINKVASITKFNTSAESAFRGAFRECVKLSSGNIKSEDPKTKLRLKTWLTVGHEASFGSYAVLGARLGAIYGIENFRDEKRLAIVNNFSQLTDLFESLGEVKGELKESEIKLKSLNSELFKMTSAERESIKGLVANNYV